MIFRDKQGETRHIYPLLPLRGMVVFPNQPQSLEVGRSRSVAAVHAAEANKGEGRAELFLLTQRNADNDSPSPDDLYDFGTLAVVEQTLRLPNNNTKILVRGTRRARVKRWLRVDDYDAVEVELFEPSQEMDAELSALVRTVKATFERFQKLNRAIPPEMLLQVNALEDPDRLADTLVAPLQFKMQERQEILELVDVRARLERLYRALLTEIEFLQVERKLKSRVKKEREANQREYWLNEQMKAIQKELGEKEGKSELEDLARALAAKDLPEEVQQRAERELRKLSQMNLMSAEATVVRNYLDWIVDLPWTELSGEPPDLARAAAILNEDHYGLRRVKERILEHLAVDSLVTKMRGPILCLVGPPGVGKTSLARSIARATGRPFVRMALGGVRDEAEIRGHRRTYIGAMPGKLIHSMKRASTVDPLLLLDEVDKMSADFRGDPAAALLEVLDPEQNNAFSDHYLDLDYDLSNVFFLCTANNLQGIPAPLQDRLEIIHLSGYTEHEKVAIAQRYLIPKQLELTGITNAHLEVTGGALLTIVQKYTRESGVRDLERHVAKIARKVARRVVRLGQDTRVRITSRNVEKVLGPPRYDFGNKEEADSVGLVKGLGWTNWGGDLLDIEVSAVPGKGKLILTGQLGDVLKESATAAHTYMRSRAEALHVDSDFHEKFDFHIHYPGPGGVEGPSAGIGMATAMVSAITGIPVRSDTAMTGEITLRGRVLPIGGLKEKLLAAHRGGITRVLIPEANTKDLEDVPQHVKDGLSIIPVRHMDRVLKEALNEEAVAEIFGAHSADTKLAVDSAEAERPSGGPARGT
ncbi:MAG: endopeptidase La [Deltaproteobacteria bacterium]|nr:MAG: endopeptidase La [Deltaproteobacteria bacterium]